MIPGDMARTWRSAWTIARRDYVAAVLSRLFLLFLILPVMLAGIGALFGAIGSGEGGTPPHAVIAVTEDYGALAAARADIVARLGDDALPRLRDWRGPSDAALVHADAVLTGGIARPALRIGAGAPDGLDGAAGLIVDRARTTARIGAVAPVHVETRHVASAPSPAPSPRQEDGDGVALAKATQYAMLILTVMLAGRLLSSFIEERGSKVIEILAASAPIDAIFIGKLIAMLLFSLTCILAWGATALIAILALAPQLLHALPTPAVGWLAFVPLTLIYFASVYLLLGAILLGLGAHASSPADIQTLAFPTTMAQLLLFAFASIDVARPDHWVAQAAALFPWSSALAMIARAAERPGLALHLLAIVWQAAWLWLTIRVAAARFRRAVLKSGPARPRRR